MKKKSENNLRTNNKIFWRNVGRRGMNLRQNLYLHLAVSKRTPLLIRVWQLIHSYLSNRCSPCSHQAMQEWSGSALTPAWDHLQIIGNDFITIIYIFVAHFTHI